MLNELLAELIHASRRREYFEHFGTWNDGKQKFYDAEISRIKREIRKLMA